MLELLKRLRALQDAYGLDVAGIIAALQRDAHAELLTADAAQLRHVARLADGVDPALAHDARSAAARLADSAASIRGTESRHAAAVHESLCGPRLRAVGPARATYVDPVSEDARAAAGAVYRSAPADAYAMRCDRGRYIDSLREQGVDVESHATRHNRKRKRRGKRGKRTSSTV